MKYKSKGFIDTVVYRGGDLLAAWLYTAHSQRSASPGATSRSPRSPPRRPRSRSLGLAWRETKMEGR